MPRQTLQEPNQEEYDLELTTAGMKKDLQAMKDFGVYEVTIKDPRINTDCMGQTP